MGKKTTVEVLVDGGKATAGAALGGTLGPLRVNIAQVVSQINVKTKEFAGMKVPVKVTVDEETIEFTLSVGTPPTTQLIKTELGLKKASGQPNLYKYDTLLMEQVIKVAKMKQDSMLVRDLKGAVKTVIGSCQSAGILVEGKDAKTILKEVYAGDYDHLISNGITEPSKEKVLQFKDMRIKLAGERERVIKELEAKKAQAAAEGAKKEATGALAATKTPAPAATKTPAAKK